MGRLPSKSSFQVAGAAGSDAPPLPLPVSTTRSTFRWWRLFDHTLADHDHGMDHRTRLRAQLSCFARAASEHEPFQAHRSGDRLAVAALPLAWRLLCAVPFRKRALRWFDDALP